MQIIDSENLIYRPIDYEDTEMILGWRNSDAVRNNFLHRDIITVEEHERWLESEIMTGRAVQFVMIDKKDDKPIGSVYFRDIDKERKTAEYGIFIGEGSARGKGYGIETAIRMTSYFFEDMRYDKLFLRVLERNRAAIRSYEAAGFKKDDIAEEREIEGKTERIIFMSITADEYCDLHSHSET